VRRSVVGGRVRACREFDPASRNFKLRDLAARVERPMRQAIRAAVAGPVIGDKNCVRSNRFHDHRPNRKIVTAGHDRDPVPIFNIVLLRKARMNLGSRFGILVYQGTDTPGLRSG